MPLSIYQKSLYVGVFNSTMIGRSVGRILKKENRRFKDFKLAVLRKSEKLIYKMEENNLSEKDIINSLDELVRDFKISYGQAQKGINVILKYHYQLYKNLKGYNGKALHCPLDSIILAEVGIRGLSLSEVDKKIYLEIQSKIAELSNIPVDFDEKYERRYLARIGVVIEKQPTKRLKI